MAWTDYSNTPSNAWDSQMGAATNQIGLFVNTTPPPLQCVYVCKISVTEVNDLSGSYNIPGFGDGYAPATPTPIANNIDQGGGGGSTRPSSGFLYPRGDN